MEHHGRWSRKTARDGWLGSFVRFCLHEMTGKIHPWYLNNVATYVQLEWWQQADMEEGNLWGPMCKELQVTIVGDRHRCVLGK